MLYHFEDYQLDLRRYALRHAGQPLKIEPKVFDVLMYLIQQRDRVVSKDELLDNVWPEQFVAEVTLSSCIMAARKAVGDSGRTQRIIQTVYGRGYRFIAAVEEVEEREEQDNRPPESRDCPVCQHGNSPGAMFCEACGRQLVPVCPECAQEVRLPATFCPACGTPLTAEPDQGQDLVGRDHELAVLHERLTQAESGQGQSVGLVGPSGIGKSWLLNAFRHSVRDKQVTYLEAHCPTYGQRVPYLPLRDLLRQYCGIRRADSPETLTAQVMRRLQEVGIDTAAATPALLRLLDTPTAMPLLEGLNPETVYLRICATLRQLLQAASRCWPVILVIEDVHWIDTASAQWLASFVEHLDRVPVLLLATYHPGCQPPWMGHSAATEVSLGPLTPDDSRRVVQAILPPVSPLSALTQAIVARAGGHPLFLTELARAIAEHGAFGPDVAVPETVRGVLMARLERLPAVQQRLLQTASVLGQTFAPRLLKAIWDAPDDVDPLLLQLEQRALCAGQPGAAEPLYAFKHALLQEVAYQRLALAPRQTLHAAVARVLEAEEAGHGVEDAALLASHYVHSGQDARAITALIRCAEYAARCGAHAEAILALRQAQTHVDLLPRATQQRHRLDLLWRQAQSLLAQGHMQEVMTCLQEQQAHLDHLQEAQLSGRYALVLSQAASHLGAWEQTAQYAHQAVAAATAGHDAMTLAQAYQVLAMERYWAGKPQEGVACGHHAIALLAQSPERWRLGMAYVVLGLNALVLGDFEAALAAETQASAIGDALGEPQLQAMAAWATGWIEASRGASAAGIAACQRSLDCSPDPLNTGFALGWLGYAYLEHGDPEEAIPLLEQASERMHQFGYHRLQSLYRTMLGESTLRRGDIDKARDLMHQGFGMATAAQYRLGMGWAQRALGQLAQASGAFAEASGCLQAALDILSALPARFEVGRTYLALAELAHRQGNRAMTSQYLSAAQRLFTALQVPIYVMRTLQRAQELECPVQTTVD